MGFFDKFRKSIDHRSLDKLADKCHHFLHQLIVVAGLPEAEKSFLFRRSGSSEIELGYAGVLQFYKVDPQFALRQINTYDAFVVIGELDLIKNYSGRSDRLYLASQSGNLAISAFSMEAAKQLSKNHKDLHLFK